MHKKLLRVLFAIAVSCTMFATPVSAAATQINNVGEISSTNNFVQASLNRDYFSGISGTMNSLYGSQSRAFNISSGSIDTSSKITSVEVNVTVSSGSNPFYLVLVDPSGYSVSKLIGASGQVTFNEFNGQYAEGTWKTYIITTATVSTATARFTLNYQY
jgi:hypothetical protein